MLPNRYISANVLKTSEEDTENSKGVVFDTGIKPSSTLNVNAMFYARDNSLNYIFGARNTNSTSSAGQFGFYAGGGDNKTGKNAICYYNQQKQVSTGGMGGNIYMENNGYKFVMNHDNANILNVEGSTTAFTGNYNIYIGAMNNAGNILFGTRMYKPAIYAFRFFNNEILTADFVPAYDTTSQQFGLYDQLNDDFKANIGNGNFPTYYLLEVDESDGGDAYIETVNSGLVKKQYCTYGNLYSSSDVPVYDTVIKAVPRKGYSFKDWTINGVFYSKDEITEINISADTVIKANFVKSKTVNTVTGYTVMGIKYGFSLPVSNTDPNAQAGQIYGRAKRFEVKEDALGKTTSSIEMQEVPSGFLVGIPVFLMSAKGKVLYIGIINNIEDNMLYCREVLSLFEFDYVFQRFSNNTETIPEMVIEKLGQLKQGSLADVTSAVQQYELISRKFSFLYQYRTEKLSYNRPMLFTMPSAQASISSMEEYFQGFFDSYGLYAKPSLIGVTSMTYPNKGVYQMLGMTIEYNDEDPLVLGDNAESISNITIDVRGEHATLLFIMNESTTATRAIYALKTDGSAAEIPSYSLSNESQYIANNECVTKIVWTDDADLRTIVEGNLVNGNYNHKITFNVDLSYGQFRFEDFNIGRRADFYVGDKLYHSVITSREFESAEDSSEIKTIKVVLGKVRNTLTSKMNAGKA